MRFGSASLTRRTQNGANPSSNSILAVVAVLPFDAETARAAAELRKKLEDDGERIGPIDTLVAATALAQKGTLVTRNVREFSRVRGLRVENWYD